jgi:hypothetical protein
MAQANGGGIKGYYRFFKGWIECMFGKHRYSYVFRKKQMKTCIECAFCWKEKNK